MSLVNLAHVCSHLQNASLARLGLTSVPYTRLHLSLSLLLHKQGFISTLKLAGPSPPASSFPPGQQQNTYPPSDIRPGNTDNNDEDGERALAEMVYKNTTPTQLHEQGFTPSSIAWAATNALLSKPQLERQGYDSAAIDFLTEHAHKTPSQLQQENFPDQAITIIQRYSIQTAMAAIEPIARQLLDTQLAAQGTVTADELSDEVFERRLQPLLEQQTRLYLRRQGFDVETLRYFAGEEGSKVTPALLQRDGIALEAMGLTIPNQPLTAYAQAPAAATDPQHLTSHNNKSATDPWHLETEGLVTQRNRASRRLWLGLKYYDGIPVLRKARLVSKPTKRIWLSTHDLGMVARGFSAGEVKGLRQVGEIMAVSTDKGVMEARECVERRIGGMPLCRIW